MYVDLMEEWWYNIIGMTFGKDMAWVAAHRAAVLSDIGG